MRYLSLLAGILHNPFHEEKGLRMPSLAFQTVQVFITRIGGLGLALLSNLALTRWLGLSAYGEFVYIIAWVTILAIPGEGMGTLVVRETAFARRREDETAMAGLIRWSLTNIAWVSAVLALLGFVPLSFHAGGLTVKPGAATILGLAAVPLICLQALAGSAFRGLRRVELTVFLNEIVTPGLLAAWAGGCLLFGLGSSAAMALGGRLAAFAAVLICYGLLLPRLGLSLRWQAGSPAQTAYWRKGMLSLTLLKGVNTIVARLPVLILGLMIGPEPVALYSLASRIADTVVFILFIMTMTTGPRLAELHANQDRHGMQQLVTRSTVAISAWAVPVALALILGGRWCLGWFGPSFVAGYPVLVLLVIGQTVNAVTGTIGVVLTMSGLERLVLKFHSYGLVLTAAFCAALIPVWGPVGAAAGSAAAHIFWNIALAIQLYRRLGISSCLCAPGFFAGAIK